MEVALIIAIAILAHKILDHKLKPKVLAQISIAGPTERGEENMSLVATILETDSIEEIDAKVTKLCAIRERRVAFCNQRMLSLTENKEGILDEAKKVVSEAGLKIVE